MHKIIKLMIDTLFPQNNSEAQAEDVISNIAKLQRDDSDGMTKYSCQAYSFFAYRNSAVRSTIWRLKYRGDVNAAKLFAEKMHDQLCEELAELAQWRNFDNPVLVAIPITKHKQRTRGFNQSAAICKALTKIDENRFFKYLPDVLYKIKDTKSQARVKDKRSRLENLKDSFAIKDNALIKDRNVILLDDVLTTGSTLTEATITLKKSGANRIIWVVVAH